MKLLFKIFSSVYYMRQKAQGVIEYAALMSIGVLVWYALYVNGVIPYLRIGILQSFSAVKRILQSIIGS